MNVEGEAEGASGGQGRQRQRQRQHEERAEEPEPVGGDQSRGSGGAWVQQGGRDACSGHLVMSSGVGGGGLRYGRHLGSARVWPEVGVACWTHEERRRIEQSCGPWPAGISRGRADTEGEERRVVQIALLGETKGVRENLVDRAHRGACLAIL